MQNIKKSSESDIRERTRLILDWDKPFARYDPYRIRRFSGGSTCSSDSSEPSPSSVSSIPGSPNPAVRSARDIQIFEELRRFVPTIRPDKNAFRVK
ncbi:hypothetical protein DICVIV_01303 [Dictyocaulus viviparus]|uniref:Uncharacterized protein n=1 Tax=Dictyocaulus viviparus TaxID=29172 RepID=A0A0D8Y6G9_DICVI|nr:hypothetical protein DICVIV_01303 [Dictyocaulus viviparus]